MDLTNVEAFAESAIQKVVAAEFPATVADPARQAAIDKAVAGTVEFVMLELKGSPQATEVETNLKNLAEKIVAKASTHVPALSGIAQQLLAQIEATPGAATTAVTVTPATPAAAT